MVLLADPSWSYYQTLYGLTSRLFMVLLALYGLTSRPFMVLLADPLWS